MAGVDYAIFTTPPASPEFPDVELITGSLTWRILSIDLDNPDFIGDIGEIRCPHPENFAVTIRNDAVPSTHGARVIKAIRMVPTGAANYTNITEGRFGGITDDLTVAANSSGTGGEAWLFVGGSPLTANMNIHRAANFSMSGFPVAGTVTIDELVGNLDINELTGNLTIAKATALSEQSFARLRIFAPISGSVTVTEIENNDFFVFFRSGIAETGRVTFGSWFSSEKVGALRV
jgi:hypothetical protein